MYVTGSPMRLCWLWGHASEHAVDLGIIYRSKTSRAYIHTTTRNANAIRPLRSYEYPLLSAAMAALRRGIRDKRWMVNVTEGICSFNHLASKH